MTPVCEAGDIERYEGTPPAWRLTPKTAYSSGVVEQIPSDCEQHHRPECGVEPECLYRKAKPAESGWTEDLIILFKEEKRAGLHNNPTHIA
jgi:hypothetical protein